MKNVMALHCTELFSIAPSLSQYDLNIVKRYVKHQIIIIYSSSHFKTSLSVNTQVSSFWKFLLQNCLINSNKSTVQDYFHFHNVKVIQTSAYGKIIIFRLKTQFSIVSDQYHRIFIAPDKVLFVSNFIDIFLISARKHLLWVFIRSASSDVSNEYPQQMISCRNKKEIFT